MKDESACPMDKLRFLEAASTDRKRLATSWNGDDDVGDTAIGTTYSFYGS